ncbi:MAG: type II toxin-antitoxin system HipA family toxin [Solirubrobacteraceae bacterium]
MAETTVEVIVQIAAEDLLAGRLWAHRRGATESATFAYANDYLTSDGAYALDPGLPLVHGAQQTAADAAIFGCFSDCAPDSWGRRLIQRGETLRARDAQETERSIGEADYLLGVRDDLRQGALRFRIDTNSAHLAQESHGVPSLLDLPVLLHAAEHVERDEAESEDLRVLLRGGSSLGGARPKAHVRCDDGSLGIAKFPRAEHDGWDVIRWEHVALTLASRAGVNVPRHELVSVGGRPVLIVRRFDRDTTRRIGYVSAMTMLEARDGDTRSYLELAEAIETFSATVKEDLRELWRRIVFSVLISNTDDHLRNHGFLHAETSGWSLAPAFDLNPDPQPGPKHLRTAIDEHSTAADLQTAYAVAPLFRLPESTARTVVAEVASATRQWRSVAEESGLRQGEIERMRGAFEHEQASAALSDRAS